MTVCHLYMLRKAWISRQQMLGTQHICEMNDSDCEDRMKDVRRCYKFSLRYKIIFAPNQPGTLVHFCHKDILNSSWINLKLRLWTEFDGSWKKWHANIGLIVYLCWENFSFKSIKLSWTAPCLSGEECAQRDNRGSGCEEEWEHGDAEPEVNNKRRCTWIFPRVLCF